MARPRTHDEDVRRRLLDEATAMVAERGAAALTVRGLAARSGTTTAAIYTLFESRAGVFAAIHAAAFAQFAADQEALVSGTDPLEDLTAIALGYRAWALAHRHQYALMFGGDLIEWLPEDYDMTEAWSSQETLRRTSRAFLAGLPDDQRPDLDTMVTSMWSAAHGFIQLELQDLLPAGANRDEAYFANCAATLRYWAPSLFD